MLQADNLHGIDPYSRKVLLGRPSALAGQLCEVVKRHVNHGIVHQVFGAMPTDNNFMHQVFGAVAGDCSSFEQAFGNISAKIRQQHQVFGVIARDCSRLDN